MFIDLTLELNRNTTVEELLNLSQFNKSIISSFERFPFSLLKLPYVMVSYKTVY